MQKEICDPHPFSTDEYQIRLERVRKIMQNRNIDVLFCTEPENIYYLTGMQTVGDPSIHLLFVPVDDSMHMMTRKLEESNVDYRSILTREQRTSYTDFESPFDRLVKYIRDKGYHNMTVGFEYQSHSYKYHIYHRLEKLMKDCQFVDASDIVGSLRLVKSSEELEKHQAAAHITAGGIQAMIDATYEGMTENQIAAKGYHKLFSMGSTYAGYPIFVSSGPHGALGHATSATRTVRKGDIVFLELTGIVDRYSSPIMRTVYIGTELPPWLQMVSDSVDKAVTEAMRVMCPGVRCSDVDRVTREIIRDCADRVWTEHQYRVTQLARSAYSVGVNFMIDWGEGEYLSFSSVEERELRENMIFHLIPWVQIWDEEGHPVGGVGLSETVLVTKEGGRSMFDSYHIPRQILPVMKEEWDRNVFCSDNSAPCHQLVLEDLDTVNKECQLAYGRDTHTKDAINKLRETFGPEAHPFVVSVGTAANVLGISSLVKSTDLIICAQESHLFWDECGSLEKMAGCQVISVPTETSKITIDMVHNVQNRYPDIPHRSRVKVVSITQPTEKGMVYTVEELLALTAYCHEYGIMVHLDGSRLSNAAVALGKTVRETTYDVGIDILTFGLSKNGAIDAEVIIFFNRAPEDFDKLIKQMGQLKSKVKYTSQQIVTMLKNNLYLDCATNANTMAKYFAERLREYGVMPIYSVETNMIFIEVDKKRRDHILDRYNLLCYPNGDSYILRLLTSWNTREEEIDGFFNDW